MQLEHIFMHTIAVEPVRLPTHVHQTKEWRQHSIRIQLIEQGGKGHYVPSPNRRARQPVGITDMTSSQTAL